VTASDVTRSATTWCTGSSTRPWPANTRLKPFARQETRRILDATKEHRNAARRSVALVLGIRQGEALGLRWSIEQSVHVRVVQETLGHPRASTTERYTHVASPQIRDAGALIGSALWGTE
jgi:integrase